jgi:hypothetical protein
MLGWFARRRAFRRAVRASLARFFFERAFAAGVAFVRAKSSDAVKQVVRENPPQPAEPLFLGPPAIALPIPCGFEQRLLHDVGCVELVAQPGVHADRRRQRQVAAILPEYRVDRLVRRHRKLPPGIRLFREREKSKISS